MHLQALPDQRSDGGDSEFGAGNNEQCAEADKAEAGEYKGCHVLAPHWSGQARLRAPTEPLCVYSRVNLKLRLRVQGAPDCDRVGRWDPPSVKAVTLRRWGVMGQATMNRALSAAGTEDRRFWRDAVSDALLRSAWPDRPSGLAYRWPAPKRSLTDRDRDWKRPLLRRRSSSLRRLIQTTRPTMINTATKTMLKTGR